MNVILNSDLTRKNSTLVSEEVARDADSKIDVLETDIFITDALPIPDELISPQAVLSEDGKEILEWVEGATQLEVDTHNTLISQRELLNQLSDSDKVIPRYLEDLTDLLILKSLITLEELPVEASEAYSNKKLLRGQLT